MTYQKIEKVLIWTVKSAIYLTTLAPLLLAASFFFPAIFPKAVFIRLLVELALAAYIPLAILSPRFRPRWQAVYGALAVFALAVFISSAHGVNWSYSFWGNYERMDGIFSWLHFWVLIVLAGSVFKTKRDWQTLLGASILVAMTVAGYGFLQRLGSSLVYDSGTIRITGTIGNPGFLAAYLLFNATFALTIVIDNALIRWWRILAAVALAWLAVGLLLSGIRGVFLGLVVGTLVFFIGYFFWTTTAARRYILAGFSGLFVILALLFIFRTSSLVSSNSFLKRYFDLSLADSTVQTRLISWNGALKSLPDYLWLGVGPQKFDVVFNKYFDPRFYSLVGSETWWDRAHNMALEVLTTMGVIGLAAYLAVGAALLWLLWQLGNKHPAQRIEALLLGSFLVAYFIQNLFVFDSISTYLMLALLMGYIVSRHAELTVSDRGRRPAAVINPTTAGLLVALAVAALAPVAYAYNVKLIKHNLLFLHTLAQSSSQPANVIVNAYRDILDMTDFDQREVVIKLGQYLGQVGLSGTLTVDQLQSGYNFFMVAADKAIKANPADVRLLLSYGNAINVYGELMKTKDPNLAGAALQKAEKALLAAAALGRSRQQVFYSLANTYLIAGENQKGIDILQETARIHEETPTTYWLLAFAYLQAKDNDKATAVADLALDKNYVFNDEKEANPIAGLYIEKKDYTRLLRLYQRVSDTVSTGTAQARLAALYAQMGRKDEALAAADAVIARDPSLRTQVEEFIQQVKTGSKKDFLSN